MNENHEHEFPDELISAYLDGELSPAEKVRVEEQLMDSPEHRRLFEELKSLRRSLQSLPAESLDDDFAARVLRRAERELLADVPPVDKAKPNAADRGVNAGGALLRSERGVRRGLLWSIAATAAAVGLVVFGPLFNDRTREVSQRHQDPVDAELKPAEELSTSVKEVDNGRTPTTSAKIKANREGESREAPPPPAVASDGSPADEQQRTNLSDFDANLMPDRGVVDAPAGANFSTERNRSKDRSTPAELSAGEKQSGEAAQTAKRAEKAQELGKFGSGRGGVDQAQGNAAFGEGPQLAMRSARQQASVPSSAVALVRVDFEQRAFAGRLFDQLLVRHGIDVEAAEIAEASPADASPIAESINQVAQAKRFDEVGARPADSSVEAEEIAADDAVRGEAGAGQGGGQAAAELANHDKQKHAPIHEDVDVMYVVATQSQIDGLLRDLGAQSDKVVAVAYDGIELPKKAQTEGAERAWQLRELSDLKELQHAPAETRYAAPFDAKNESIDDVADNRPQAQAHGVVEPPAEEATELDEVRLKADGAADELSAQLESPAKSGFARRLALAPPSVAKMEEQLRRANAAPPAAPARGDGARDATDKLGDVGAEAGQDFAEGNAPAPEPPAADAAAPQPAAKPEAESVVEAEGALPPASAANGVFGFREEAKTAKSKGLVRVLFVLRSVAPRAANPVEATEVPANNSQR
jgi:hypothetical protein